MKALKVIGYTLLAICAGAIAGAVIAASILVAAVFALLDAAFRISPQKPVSDE